MEVVVEEVVYPCLCVGPLHDCPDGGGDDAGLEGGEAQLHDGKVPPVGGLGFPAAHHGKLHSITVYIGEDCSMGLDAPDFGSIRECGQQHPFDAQGFEHQGDPCVGQQGCHCSQRLFSSFFPCLSHRGDV